MQRTPSSFRSNIHAGSLKRSFVSVAFIASEPVGGAPGMTASRTPLSSRFRQSLIAATGYSTHHGSTVLGTVREQVMGSDRPTLLADVVAASGQVAATAARSRKVAILAELLARLADGEVSISVGFLSGVPRQGRVGVGYSMIYGLEVTPARDASLTIFDVDAAIAAIEAATGRGSAARRRQILEEMLA